MRCCVQPLNRTSHDTFFSYQPEPQHASSMARAPTGEFQPPKEAEVTWSVSFVVPWTSSHDQDSNGPCSLPYRWRAMEAGPMNHHTTDAQEEQRRGAATSFRMDSAATTNLK